MASVPVLQDKEEFDVILQVRKVSHQGLVTIGDGNTTIPTRTAGSL